MTPAEALLIAALVSDPAALALTAAEVAGTVYPSLRPALVGLRLRLAVWSEA